MLKRLEIIDVEEEVKRGEETRIEIETEGKITTTEIREWRKIRTKMQPNEKIDRK